MGEPGEKTMGYQREDGGDSFMRRGAGILEKYWEPLSYLFWGGMTTVVSWGSYSVFAYLFGKHDRELVLFGIGMSFAVVLANVWSWVCAVVFAFVTNKVWVFRSRSWKPGTVWKEFGKFVSARLITGVFEVAAVPVLVGIGMNETVFGIEGLAAKAGVSVLVVVLNYIFSKLLIFRTS